MTDDCTEALLLFIRETFANGTFTLHEVAALPKERWQRGQDGVARPSVVLARRYLTLQDDVPTSSPYRRMIEALRNDPDFGPILGGMIGDSMVTSRFDESTLITHALNAPVIERKPEMNEQAVRDEIAGLREYVKATERLSHVLIPLPGLKSDLLPVEIEGGIQIDNLSDDEITACVETGILQPPFPTMAILTEDECVGIRIECKLPAVNVAPGSQRHSVASEEALTAPHVFGERSAWRFAELAEDVLFVMRLARPETITSRGAVHAHQSLSGTSRSWSTRRTPQIVRTSYVIDEATARDIGELWKKLRSTPQARSLPRICLRRFNAAIDQNSLEDAIVDHVIAAEALLLKDVGGTEGRGELGFRLALRAGALLEADGRHRRSTFKFMKKAYDLRSKVVHGGTAEQEIQVPERGIVHLSKFVDELSQLMREALRKAVREYYSQSNFATQPYWDELLLGSLEALDSAGPPDVPSEDA